MNLYSDDKSLEECYKDAEVSEFCREKVIFNLYEDTLVLKEKLEEFPVEKD